MTEITLTTKEKSWVKVATVLLVLLVLETVFLVTAVSAASDYRQWYYEERAAREATEEKLTDYQHRLRATLDLCRVCFNIPEDTQ